MVRNLIAITGIPGSGKTTLSKLLESFGICKRLPEDIVEKSFVDYDEERDVYIVDEEKFEKVIKEFLDKNNKEVWCLDSLLSHFSPRDNLLLLIHVKCDEKTLVDRLKKKGYSEKKIMENVLSNTLDIIEREIKERNIKYYIEVWTDKKLISLDEDFLVFLNGIIEFLKNKK